jgi:DNA-binding response OmpR family regulator
MTRIPRALCKFLLAYFVLHFLAAALLAWILTALVRDRMIDVHIRSLRKKLGGENQLIQTVRGIGGSATVSRKANSCLPAADFGCVCPSQGG